MIKPDPYAVLGVARDAAPEVIKAAFRSLASRWHPDRNPETLELAQQMMAQINEAYAVIGDAERREQFDRTGKQEAQADEDRVKSMIMESFVALLGHPNPLSQLRLDVSSQIGTQEQNIAKMEDAIAQCEKKIGRIRRKDEGPNYLRMALEGQIGALRQSIEQGKENLALGERLLAFLDAYEMEDEPPPPQQLPSWYRALYQNENAPGAG